MFQRTNTLLSAAQVLTALIVLLVLIVPSAQSTQPEFKAGAIAKYQFGHTLYHFDGLGIGSELVFPLESFAAGLTGDMTVYRDDLPLWSLTASMMVALNDPGDPFTDRDWHYIPPGLEVNFSFTESDIDFSMWQFYLEGSHLMYQSEGVSLYLVAGIGYEKLSYDALGYRGVQLEGASGDSALIYRPVSSDRLALTYDITYLTPRLGIRPRIEFGPDVLLELTAAGSPVVYVDDRDEHLLRNFVMESDGRGYGFFSQGKLEYRFGENGKHFVRLHGDLNVMGADLGAAIHWYGDDSIDEEDNTGQSGIGIPHNIRSTQYSVGVSFGLML